MEQFSDNIMAGSAAVTGSGGALPCPPAFSATETDTSYVHIAEAVAVLLTPTITAAMGSDPRY